MALKHILNFFRKKKKGRSAIIDCETTGLNPLEDRLIFIGVHILEMDTKVIIDCVESEKEGLIKFWDLVEGYNITKLIGFNIDFDWTFIKLKSLRYRIRMKHFRKYEGRVDLRLILNSNRFAKGGLDDYAKFLGLNINDIKGSEVPKLYERYLEGDKTALDTIKRHLKRDLERTKYIFDALVECGLLEDYNI